MLKLKKIRAGEYTTLDGKYVIEKEYGFWYGYNAETGEMTNGTWTFATPVDLSNWKFIIIAMEDGCADASHEISITDNNGQTVKGSQYDGTVAGTGTGTGTGL